MGVLLAHGDFGWVVAGLVAFLGIVAFLYKIARGQIFTAALSALVWYFVYTVHSGSTQGIMTATLAAFFFDTIGIFILRKSLRQ